MEGDTFSKIELESKKALQYASAFKQKRYLYDKISTLKDNFYVGIFGLRGVGKTILMLQLALNKENPLYISADAKYMKRYSLYDTVNFAFSHGYKNIFLDEIGSAADWTYDLKTLYDEHNVNVVFSSSSSISVRKGADLSRRALLYELKPASFREYLNIKKGASIPALSLEDLYNEVSRKELAMRYSNYINFVYEYLKYGGVLYDGIADGYPESIINIVDKIVSTDLSYLREIDAKIENDTYKLLYEISSSGPYEVSYNGLAARIGASTVTVIKLVSDLEKVGIIKLVYPVKGKFKKEPKIFFRIPFRIALNDTINVKSDPGIMREEFFINNVDVQYYFKTERGMKTPDFYVDGKAIEVGGTAKTKVQHADFIASDGLDFHGNKIPLFLFGFLY
ncbi:MAG: ATP-binding protein [Nitrososphaerota archaeon]|jgi:predicted AAA+ superfamily ATPase|nr:ATP-binding protein [Nitrososphaerota archaeon]